jgi:hypothetical protein
MDDAWLGPVFMGLLFKMQALLFHFNAKMMAIVGIHQ